MQTNKNTLLTATTAMMIMAMAPTTSQAQSPCIERTDVDGLIEAFATTVPAISKAYFENGGGPAGSATKEACQAAYDVAVKALDTAYGYGSGQDVLFKPTLTAQPYTLRPTRAGALSYFIGTECLNLAGTEQEQFPPGNYNGGLFQEFGFGLNNKPGYSGWAVETVWDPDRFQYQLATESDNTFCDSALAMGQICFTPAHDAAQRICVDKTFGFSKTPENSGVVITAHHSSAKVSFEASNVVCQTIIGGDQDFCKPNDYSVPPPSTSSKGLSAGAITGIVLGSIFGFLILAGLLCACKKSNRTKADDDTSSGDSIPV